MQKLRNNERFVQSFTYILCALSLWYVIWSFFGGGIGNLRYFTNQSNVIVLLVMGLIVTKKTDQPYFKYLAAVALINIFITATGYHFILAPDSVNFKNHLSHTIIPILFIAFYFIVLDEVIAIRQFWIGILYPMIYLLMSIIFGSINGFYPYGFLNVSENGLENVLRFTLAVLFPIYTLIAYGLIYLKQKVVKTAH